MLQAAKELQVESLQQDAMNKSTDTYVDLQKDQLFEGILSDGGDIVPEYSPLTKDIKRGKGQPIDRVTLKDTGEFHAGIYAEPGTDGLMVDSRDSKSNMLQEKYSEEIFGLSKKNGRRSEWLEEVEDYFITGVVKVIG